MNQLFVAEKGKTYNVLLTGGRKSQRIKKSQYQEEIFYLAPLRFTSITPVKSILVRRSELSLRFPSMWVRLGETGLCHLQQVEHGVYGGIVNNNNTDVGLHINGNRRL